MSEDKEGAKQEQLAGSSKSPEDSLKKKIAGAGSVESGGGAAEQRPAAQSSPATVEAVQSGPDPGGRPPDGAVSGAPNAQAAGQAKPSQSSSGQRLADWKKNAGLVARTILDVDACRKVVSNIMEGKDVDLFKKAAPDELAPAREAIRYVAASACKEKWANIPEGARVSFCEQCHLQVYDLSNITQPDAEKLVLQREGRNDFTFYMRKDGKFLTNNCPVGAKAQRTKTALIALGVAIPVILLLLALLNPPPKTPPAHPVEANTKPEATPSQPENKKVTPQAQSELPKSPGPAGPGGHERFSTFMGSPGSYSPPPTPQPAEQEPASETVQPAPGMGQVQTAGNAATAGPAQTQYKPQDGSASQTSAMPPLQSTTGNVGLPSTAPPSAQGSAPGSAFSSPPASSAPTTQSYQISAPASAPTPSPPGGSSAPAEQSPYVWQRQ